MNALDQDQPLYAWVHDDPTSLSIGNAIMLGGDIERCHRRGGELPKSVYVLNPATSKLAPVTVQEVEAADSQAGFDHYQYKILRGQGKVVEEFSVLVERRAVGVAS